MDLESADYISKAEMKEVYQRKQSNTEEDRKYERDGKETLSAK